MEYTHGCFGASLLTDDVYFCHQEAFKEEDSELSTDGFWGGIKN